MKIVEVSIVNPSPASPLSRTLRIQNVDDVSTAADAVVEADAGRVEAHSTVQRSRHDDHLVLRTRRLEEISRTKLT